MESKKIMTNLNCTVLKRKSDISHPHYDIVLLEIDEGKDAKEYSTHVHNLQTRGIANGHYFIKLEDAEKDYTDRKLIEIN